MRRDSEIRVVDLWKSFDGKAVLGGINFEVHEGETLVVLGPSGCGKSVLLKHVVGLMRPDRGSVYVDGLDVAELDRIQLGEVRKRIGMVFQGSALFDSMTVGQNVGLGPREHMRMKGSELSDLVDEKLRLVGLTDVSSLAPSQISGGMKKRVALARAIAMDPDIMLYDEPTAGLDPVMAEQINDLIRDLQEQLETTSIVVTHDLHSACYIGDRIALLDSGRIAFVGTKDELEATANEAVRRFMARGHAGRPVTMGG